MPTYKLGVVNHLLEAARVLLDRVVAVLAGHTVHAHQAHLLLGRVVDVGLALLDELPRELKQLGEPVRGVRDLVGHNVEQLQVLDDGVLKLGLYIKKKNH